MDKKLSSQQQMHSREMNDLSSNLKDKILRLQVTNKTLFRETQNSHSNEINTLKRRIQKL